MNEREKSVFKLACLSGGLMLESGAETFRAEDTVRYICSAASLTADVLAMPTGMFVSAESDGEEQRSMVRRVKKRSIDLGKIHEINNVSRRFVAGELTVDDAISELENLGKQKPVNKIFLVFCAGISALFFTLLFGGELFDAVVSFAASCAVQILLLTFKKTDIYNLTSNLIVGTVISLFSVISVSLFSMGNSEAIIVGGILPYLPGLAMLNAIRDTIMGDLVSGVSRLGEVLLSAVSLALGVGVVFAVYMALGGIV